MNRPRLLSLLFVLVVLLVSALVLRYYFPNFDWSLTLKTLAAPFYFLLWKSRVSDVLACAFIVLAAFSLGRFIFRRLFAELPITPVEDFLFSTAIGFGSLALILFFLAVTGVLYVGVISALCLVLVLLIWTSRRPVAASIRGIGALYRRGSESRWLWYGTHAFTVTMTAMIFTAALTPPTDPDTVFYHLADPLSYLQAHRYVLARHSTNLMPENMEMIYMLAMFLKSGVTAKLVHFSFLILTIVTMQYYAERLFGERIVGALASAVVASMPVVGYTSGLSTSNDMAVAFYSLLMLISLLLWYESSSNRYLLSWGMLLGFVLGIKHTVLIALPFFALFILWVVVVRRREGAPGRLLLTAVACGLIGLAIAAPWYVKSYIYSGNPVWPLFPTLFSGEANTLANELVHSTKASFAIWNWGEAYKIPYFMIFGSGGREDGIIGPMYLLAIPFMLFYHSTKGSKAFRFFLLFFLTTFGVWALQLQLVRHAIFLFPPLALCASSSFAEFLQRARSGGATIVRAVVVVLVTALAILSLPPFAYEWYRPQRYTPVTSRIPALTTSVYCDDISVFDLLMGGADERYLERSMGSYALTRFINDSLDQSARILYIGSGPPLYFARREMLWYERDRDRAKLGSLADMSGFTSALRNQKISHVFVDVAMRGPGFWLARRDNDAVQANYSLVGERNNCILLEVRHEPVNPALMPHVYYDLINHADSMEVIAPARENEAERSLHVGVYAVCSDVRQSLLLKANSEIRFPVVITPHSYVKFSLGKMFPELGDGGICEMLIDNGSGARKIFSASLNPRVNSKDRGWMEYAVALPDSLNGRAMLEFRTDLAGRPDIGAWFVWGRPVVERHPVIVPQVDLISQLHEAVITPVRKEPTPSGGPVFRSSTAGEGGQLIPTLVTVAPCQADFHIQVPPGTAFLTVDVTMAATRGDGAIAEVNFVSEHGSEKLLSQAVVPRMPGSTAPLRWSARTVDLRRYAGQAGILRLVANTGPRGDAIADWIMWRNITVITVE